MNLSVINNSCKFTRFLEFKANLFWTNIVVSVCFHMITIVLCLKKLWLKDNHINWKAMSWVGTNVLFLQSGAITVKYRLCHWQIIATSTAELFYFIRLRLISPPPASIIYKIITTDAHWHCPIITHPDNSKTLWNNCVPIRVFYFISLFLFFFSIIGSNKWGCGVLIILTVKVIYLNLLLVVLLVAQR